MSVGGIAGLIAAVAFVLLVGALAVPLMKLGRVFDEASSMIKGLSDETVPLLRETTATVATTNAQLAHVDAIATNVEAVASNVSALTAVYSATLGGPAIRVASFTYGVRRALGRGSRSEIAARARAERRVGRHGKGRAA
jgi:hypothetical protein